MTTRPYNYFHDQDFECKTIYIYIKQGSKSVYMEFLQSVTTRPYNYFHDQDFECKTKSQTRYAIIVNSELYYCILSYSLKVSLFTLACMQILLQV